MIVDLEELDFAYRVGYRRFDRSALGVPGPPRPPHPQLGLRIDGRPPESYPRSPTLSDNKQKSECS